MTFGAPPVVTQPLGLASFPRQRKVGLCLNIINEFDIVSRADAPYILCLVNLLRSIYGQPPLPDDTDDSIAIPNNIESGLKDVVGDKESNDANPPAAEKSWPVPPLGYHHVGTRVVLLMRLDGSQLRLKAMEVPGDKFGQLLFCRVAVHHRACYSARIQELVECSK